MKHAVVKPIDQAIRDAQKKADDYYWIKDHVRGAYWDKEVKRLEKLAQSGEEYEVNF